MIDRHYIISYKRAHRISPYNKSCTWYNIPPAERERTAYVVRRSELADYASRGVRVLALADDYLIGPGPTRQRLVDRARRKGYNTIAIHDDDVDWIRSYEEQQENGSYQSKLSDKQREKFWRKLPKLGRKNKKCAVVGFGYAHVQLKIEDPVIDPTYFVGGRHIASHVLFLERIPRDVWWDLIPYGEDFAFLLQLYERGLVNQVMKYIRLAQNHNRDGGCAAAGRNIAVHNCAMLALQRRWPQYVGLSNYNNKGGYTRELKVRISWKRAAQDGGAL